MSVWRLVIREILHRRLSFALAVASVFVAVGCLVGAVTLLRAHDLRTDSIIRARIADTAAKVADRQAQADKRAAELEEAYRKIMLKFGYNLLILPVGESAVDYHVQGGPSKYMDEQNVRKLADSRIMTVRHLLPILQQKQVLIFGDKRLEVFLVGTRGEVPIRYRAPKKPLLTAVPPGEMIVGYEVHRELGLKQGDTVKLVDRPFKINKWYPPRGTKDDSSVWIDLAEAQDLLGKPGKINGILAISCICTRAGIEEIKKDIMRILPDTQVRVMTTNAVIRYEARVRAAEEAKAQVQIARRQGLADVERERRARAELRGQIEAFASWIVPIVLVAAALWVALLALGNVRQRRSEIGLLRALGLRTRQIFAVFLARAFLSGLAGTVLGCAAGFAVALAWSRAPGAGDLFDPLTLAGVLLLAPLLSVLGGWMPAMLAAQQDPAPILQEE